MVAEATVEHAFYGNTDDGKPSEEKMALMDFAYRLGSCNFPSDSGIADEEGNTRKEAKLLMCLLSSPPRIDNDELEPISASESERSYASESSYSRREVFSFTCPSLSLESSKGLSSPSYLRGNFPTQTRRLSDSDESTSSQDLPRPAALLGRTLMVDDRDALRLSADAMARNVRHSFQKAIEWRIQAWTHGLSKSLVRKEQELKASGASEHDLRELLETGEARLIVQLGGVRDSILVTGAGTSFQVLAHLDSTEKASGEPRKKKQKVVQPSYLEEGDYQYKVSHVLVMDCSVSLQTPAGFSEVTLQVPGTIEGTFLSSETGLEELQSVVIELDTDILAAMVEKSCRTLVRTSVEAVGVSNEQEGSAEGAGAVPPAHSVVKDLKTPPPVTPARVVTAADVRAALITPRALLSDANHDCNGPSPKPVLMPIPDTFDETSTFAPRRISPQPRVGSPASGCSPTFTPRTPSVADRMAGPPLISPPVNEASVVYREVPENGPSLPMLVEAACRAMEGR